MVMTFANGDKIYHVELNSMVDAHDDNGVLTGLEITAQSTPNMTVRCGIGQCHVDNEQYEETSSRNISLTSGHDTYPRIDIIYFSTSAGYAGRSTGIPAATPLPKDIPAGDILLATVYVPVDDTAVESSQITDERVFVKPMGLYYIASDSLLDSSDNEEFHSVGTYTKEKELTIPDDIFSNDSTLRIKFDIKTTNNAVPVYGRIYRNGVAVGTQRETYSTSYDPYSEDISGWSAGDLIQLYTYSGDAGVVDVYVQNFRVYGDMDVKSVYNW